MIAISFSAGMIITLSAWILTKIILYIKTKTFGWKQEAREIFFLINLLVIVRFTFTPFPRWTARFSPCCSTMQPHFLSG